MRCRSRPSLGKTTARSTLPGSEHHVVKHVERLGAELQALVSSRMDCKLPIGESPKPGWDRPAASDFPIRRR
jgi:hypothetical protein